MDWRDEGAILAVRPHGESGAILDVLTAAHGRHAGLVRGGTGRRLAPILQPGNPVEVTWRGRPEAHPGPDRVELPQRRRASVPRDRTARAGPGWGSVSAGPWGRAWPRRAVACVVGGGAAVGRVTAEAWTDRPRGAGVERTMRVAASVATAPDPLVSTGPWAVIPGRAARSCSGMLNVARPRASEVPNAMRLRPPKGTCIDGKSPNPGMSTGGVPASERDTV